MKSTAENRDKYVFAKALLFGITVGYITAFLLVLLFALVFAFAGLPASYAGVFATVAISVASFTGGFTAARKLGSGVLLVGLATGVAFYISVAVIAAAVTKEGLTSLFLLRILLSFALSGIGAFSSAFGGKRKKII